MTPKVTAFFDEPTFTASFVVAEPDGDKCAVIDPVLDYEPKPGAPRPVPPIRSLPMSAPTVCKSSG